MKILIYAVLSRDRFCRKFMHFFGVQFSKASKCVGVQKWTNMRYAHPPSLKVPMQRNVLASLHCANAGSVLQLYGWRQWVHKESAPSIQYSQTQREFLKTEIRDIFINLHPLSSTFINFHTTFTFSHVHIFTF